MPKHEIRDWLSKLLPYLKSAKQRLALFSVLLLLALAPLDFDSVHLHVESDPDMIVVSQAWSASANATPQIFTSTWRG